MPPEIAFRHDYTFEYGVLETVSPGIRRVVARNAGPYTFHGTGTYVIGRGNVAVIDPGPASVEHIEALLKGLGGESISHVLVTHTHLDHSPGAALLRQHSDAPTYGFGPHGAGKFLSGEQVEEGADFDFVPDISVGHGDVIEGDEWSFECVHTPGHTSNHLCFQYREPSALFSGDHVMGWSTTVISPPDGDMSAYMQSLRLLLDRDDKVFWPTHGSCIDAPHPYVRSFIEHRSERVRQILECIQDGTGRVAEMVPRMYPHLDAALHPAAARQVFAAVLSLLDEHKIYCDGPPAIDAHYQVR
jgi:glyoxylase-like metal-dependent hydrolase (beta-lactamase superfamily II)